MEKGPKADPLSEQLRFSDPENAAALRHDVLRCRRIDRAVIAQLVCAAEDAIRGPWNGVHERSIVTDDSARETHPGHDRNLAAVRFEVGGADQRSGADAGAIDDEIEAGIDLFQFGEASVCVNLAARGAETPRQVIEVDGGVHK